MAFDPVSAGFDVAGKLIDRFLPDPTQKAAAAANLEQMRSGYEMAANQMQADVDKVEAASPNLFIAGWRPAVGWVCVIGLLSQFIIRPLFTFVAGLVHHPMEYPSLDMGTLMVLLTGMLGISTQRTIEKLSNVQGNH